MYMRAASPYMDLQAMRSSMWYPVPMSLQEPNLNFLLTMIQMLSQMRKFQYRPLSAPNIQEPVEIDIQSVIMRSQQRRNFELEDLMKSTFSEKETVVFASEKPDERGLYEMLPPEEDEVQQNIRMVTQNFEEKDELLKRTKEEVEHLTAENDRLNHELKIAKEELKRCRKNKEEEIKCNSIDNLHQITVLGPVAGWHSFVLNQSFRPGSKIVIRGRAESTVPRLQFNFNYPEGTAFHLDNRWNYQDSNNQLVMNSNIKNSWGQQVTMTPAPIERGQDFVLSVQSEMDEFKICVNGSPLATYSHRANPGSITAVDIGGAAEITSVYYQGVEQQESTQDDDNFPSDQDESDELLNEGLLSRYFGVL